MDSNLPSSARFVGRIGSLAFALGVGFGVGTLIVGAGAASADTDTASESGNPAGATRVGGQRATADRPAADSALPAAGRGPRATANAAASSPDATGGSEHESAVRVAAPASALTTQPGTAKTSLSTPGSTAPYPRIAAVVPAAAASAPTSARASTPAAAAATAAAPASATALSEAPVTAAIDAAPAPLSGSGSGSPLEAAMSWAVLAVARRLGRFDATRTAAAQTVAAAAATTGTTTTITWGWGTNPVLNFNPATDKLDFGWMQASAFTVAERAGSTKISIVDNNHSYTLANVSLAQLTTANIVAKDSGTVSKWQNLIATAQAANTTPTVSIANAAVAEGNSGSTDMVFNVSLSKAATKAVTVGYSTANGTATATATATADYTAGSGTLTFAAGTTAQQIKVKVTGDTTVEPDETFTVTLANPSGATLGTATATGTITNDDTAVVTTPPTVSIANASVAEGHSGNTNVAFNVSLSKAYDKAVTVGYSTANGTAAAGTDYTAGSGTLTFAAGTTTQQIKVNVIGDTTVEPDETFTVTLANPSGATLGTATATGTIVNDDTAVTAPPATADRWGKSFYAPYVDMGGWPVPDLLAISKSNTGGSLFTAAFMQSTPDGRLAWAGLAALTPDATNDQAQAINRSIRALKDAGGDVMISLGGQAGTSLAQWGSTHGMTAQQLANAYAGVIDTYGVTHLDFDIEGAAVADPASIALNSQALKLLQQSKPNVQIWYTLPVLPTGLTADGIKVVDSALKAGVTLAGVNVMAMDYGESAAPTTGAAAKTMGAYAIQSAESTYTQLSKLYSGYGKTFNYSQLGVTPMLGVNDVTSEVFTLADAQAVEDYARAKGVGMLALWSVTRDTPGQLGVSTYTHSGMSATAGSFAKIFNDYGTVNSLNYGSTGTTTGGTGGTTGTPVTGGTTTPIGWKWNTNTAVSFNPAKDRLDFGWMGPAYFDITQKSGSTTITIVNNQQTYTLTGVTLKQLQMGNIVALDSGTLAKWQAAISAAVSV